MKVGKFNYTHRTVKDHYPAREIEIVSYFAQNAVKRLDLNKIKLGEKQ